MLRSRAPITIYFAFQALELNLKEIEFVGVAETLFKVPMEPCLDYIYVHFSILSCGVPLRNTLKPS